MTTKYEALKDERDALAVENAALKAAITTHSQSTHFCELCGKDDPCSTDDVCYALNETPATDAALASIDALAVENAGLKSALTAKAYIDFIKSNGWNAGAKTINGKFAGFMDPEVDFGSMTFEHAKKLIDAVETTATDAALASIEARGVEKFADRMLTLANDPTYSTASHRNDLRDAGAKAMNYAAELREGK